MGPHTVGGLTGTILASRYRLLRLIKEGGMGAVYEAQDTKLGRRVAIKILGPQFTQQPEMVRRFFREAKAPSFAQHPNIVEYLDFDQLADGVAYLVMEYLQGDDLEGVLRQRGPLPWTVVAPLMLQSCRALGAAHAAGIIHRDIKPSNLILLDRTFDGEPPTIKLIDFGIAKFTEDSHLHSHTEVTEHLMGSERFIAPEMYARVAANPRTDIYALGITMYRLLTDKYPESNGYDMVPPSALQPGADIPSAVDQLILKATHVNPYARFKAMFEVESAILDSLRSESRADLRPAASATMPSRGVRLHEPSSATVIGARPRRWLAWASAAVVVTALSAASIALLLGTPSPPESTRPKIVSVAVLPASIPEPQPPPPPPPPPATEAPEPEIAPAMIPEQDPSPASDDELPALDLKFVDKQLIKQTRAVSKCGLKDGLFPGMTITVTVNIDSDGKTVTTVANGGDHDHVKCIDKVMQRLALGPSKAGGRRTHKYTI